MMVRTVQGAGNNSNENKTSNNYRILHLRMFDTRTFISVPDQDYMIIGRNDINCNVDIDLTPFGAYHLGVSRQHAIIQREANDITITDLSSRYGTTINGRYITAHEPQCLCHGDIVKLGSLNLMVSLTN